MELLEDEGLKRVPDTAPVDIASLVKWASNWPMGLLGPLFVTEGFNGV